MYVHCFDSVCVSMRVYVQVSLLSSEDVRVLEADWIHSLLMWVLRIHLWSCTRERSAFNHWVIIFPAFCFVGAYSFVHEKIPLVRLCLQSAGMTFPQHDSQWGLHPYTLTNLECSLYPQEMDWDEGRGYDNAFQSKETSTQRTTERCVVGTEGGERGPAQEETTY